MAATTDFKSLFAALRPLLLAAGLDGRMLPALILCSLRRRIEHLCDLGDNLHLTNVMYARDVLRCCSALG